MSDDIDWAMLRDLCDKPHPLFHIADDFDEQLRQIPTEWIAEVFFEARNVHHLLDMVGIDKEIRGREFGGHLDARMYLAVVKIWLLKGIVAQIRTLHRQDGGELCIECGSLWPCDTMKMTEGTYIGGE